jgi:hypothetical protein
MTGMWSFKLSLCYLSLVTLGSSAEVSFLGDSKITGELTEMDAEGVVSMTTPYSDQSIRLQADKIAKIYFGKSAQLYDLPKQNLTLINGDSFPVDIRGLDDQALQITTPFLGDLDIPRKMIQSLEIGMFAKKTIYNGPNQISEWQNSADEVSKWEVINGSLVASGNGKIYRDMKLPENYSVRFKISWEDHPNFRFYFGDPTDYSAKTTNGGKAVNRYYIQYAKAGMEIKRESFSKTSGKTSYATVGLIPRSPQEFVKKELSIEVRVNRKGGRLDLYLNDILEGRYADSSPDVPSGTTISFSAQAEDENKFSISEIEVSEWDISGDRFRSEERGNTKEDSVIGRNGERLGGSLLSITNGDKGMLYRFKSNYQEEPKDLPESEVSSIYFATVPDVKFEKLDGLSLFFQGRGSIQVSKCIFNESSLSVTHPLLGEIQLNRTAISRLERRSIKNPNPSKEK